MIKIAISGKANVGKNIAAEFIAEEFDKSKNWFTKFISGQNRIKFIALADPIKEMVLMMFPHADRDCLFGPSNLRSKIIPGAFKDGKPLTYRQICLDLGTEVGRSYNDNIWLDNLFYRLRKMETQKNPPSMVLITDVRFANEVNFLRKNGFFVIRMYRNNGDQIIKHSSETNQDYISDNEFDYILDNNKSLNYLRHEIRTNIMPKLRFK